MGITGWGNNELQYYTAEPENLALDGDGHLVITAREVGEDSDLVCWYGPCEYTSARLTTQDRLAFTYGRVEASMKLPEGCGAVACILDAGGGFGYRRVAGFR